MGPFDRINERLKHIQGLWELLIRSQELIEEAEANYPTGLYRRRGYSFEDI
jgi:hypothetical protein